MSSLRSTMAADSGPRLAVVALGANLPSARGDSPAATVRSAMDILQELSARSMLRSGLWQSVPVDCPPGSPVFVNAVVAMQPGPDTTARTLLGRLQEIEQDFGRVRNGAVNAPRVLDLDLISFAGQRESLAWLTLPHPRAHLRAFVLYPLAEILPELVLPGQSRTVAALVRELPPTDCRPLQET